MIDQCTIDILEDKIQIRPELLLKDDCLLDDWLPCQRRSRDQYAKHAPGEDKMRYHSKFDIFADRALVLHTHSQPGSKPDQHKQYAYKIEINLRKILHGQNGIPVSHDRDLCAAILIARHALSLLLVNRDQASWLIPGLAGNRHSYWRKLEIALDIRDPGFAIRDQMKYMQTPRITKPAVHYPEAVYLKGTDIELKVYDKLKEREKRFGKKHNAVSPSDDEITRLELVLPKGIIPKGFPLERDTIRRTKFNSKQRLTGFTFQDLRAIHRTYFEGIKGVYHYRADGRPGYDEGHAAAWAAVAKNHDIPSSEIRKALEKYGGKSKDTSRRIEKQMLEFMEQASTLDAETILSDDAYENPPLIGVSGLGGCRFYVEHYGVKRIYENAEEVFAVYSDQQTPARFYPIVTAESYWLPSAFSSLWQPKYKGSNTQA